MACSSPEFASHGVCATVIPISDQTTTSTSRAMVPKNLRVRMVMAKMCGPLQVGAPCAREGADYKGRANSFKRSFDDRYFRTTGITDPRRQMVAVRDRRADRDHGAGRRRHAPDRIRALDCRVEAGHRNSAAAQSGAMDRGVRRLQDYTAISRTQCRHEPGGVQDHLLVGMEPPVARARDRRRLFAAVSLVPLARYPEHGLAAAAVADLRPWRAAGRGRLVDGGLRTVATGRGFANSSRHPSGAGAADFRMHRLDTAAADGPAVIGCIFAAEDRRRGSRGADLRAALSGRIGRGLARGQGLQYLAGYRRCADSIRGAAVL